MKWITATDLQLWAARISATSVFPEMIADLIRATAKEIRGFRFPNGDKSQVRGFDGWLEASGEAPYVPEGLSVWEFGVSGANAAKALKDFKKRTREVPEEKQGSVTLVLASPYTWDDPKRKIQDWCSERRNNSRWRDVVYLDGVQIEDWLQNCPGVSAKYAAEMGLLPLDGIFSASEFWAEYTSRFKVELTEEVLLCGREAQANKLLQGLLSEPSAIQLGADSPDEVVAFAIAAVRKAEARTRFFLESRIVVLDSQEAVRAFVRRKLRSLIFFPRLQANHLSGQLTTLGPTLITHGRDYPQRQDGFLNRPSTFEFGKALETLGLSEDEAQTLARHTGRSITVLARRFAAGHVSPPEWLSQGSILMPAVLAGAWDGANESDKAIVSGLVRDNKYYEFESGLRQLTKLQDPPIDLEGSVWKVRAPVDAFVNLAHLIGYDDLKRLRAAALSVFSELDDPIDPNQPYSARTGRKRYSSWLRDGIANTLLQVAVLSKQAPLNIPGTDAQGWVNDTISAIPGLTTDYRVIASLRAELWMLLEASPSPLLAALETLLEGNHHGASGLFATDEGLFSPTSPHTFLLWALETLAWDPQYLERVAIVLARLADIDPGGRTSNRPIESLRTIFLSWSPCTYASVQHRLRTIDKILDVLPEIGWHLLLLLLPMRHDSTSPTRKPKFRDAGASQRKVLTNGDVWDANRYVINRVLELVTKDEERWISILEKIDVWPPEYRAKAISALDDWLTINGEPKKSLWDALNSLLNRHRSFSDAGWALPRDELFRLEDIVRRHQPDDVVERVSWLFKEWWVQVGAEFDENEKELKRLRIRAVEEVLEANELSRLVDAVGHPGTVALALSEKLDDRQQYFERILKAIRHNSSSSRLFASILSERAYLQYGSDWQQLIKDSFFRGDINDESLSLLVLNWRDSDDTWEYIDSFNLLSIKQAYWLNKSVYSFEKASPKTLTAIENYLDVGRPGAALQASHRITSFVPSQLLLRILDTLLTETAHKVEINQMTGYFVEQVFDALAERQDVDESALAKLEYSYLPALTKQRRKLVIHDFMAKDPHFYMGIVRSVFRSSSDEGDTQELPDVETEKRQREKWRNDYLLLSEFHTLPGSSGEAIDYEELKSWTLAVRALAAEEDRAEITDIYIGHLLAHAPEDDDGAWPHISIRRLIDDLASDPLERGVANERFNMRGIFSKALYEGGQQERVIADRYRGWAGLCSAYPRTQMLLLRLAQRYDADAKLEDERANLDRMRDN